MPTRMYHEPTQFGRGDISAKETLAVPPELVNGTGDNRHGAARTLWNFNSYRIMVDWQIGSLITMGMEGGGAL